MTARSSKNTLGHLTLAAAALLAATALHAPAAPVAIYGSPAYDASTGDGYQTESGGGILGRPWQVNDAGTAVGWQTLYDNSNSIGRNAVRWSSTAATPLGSVGTGVTPSDPRSLAYDLNAAGTAVGTRFNSATQRALRWDAGSTAPTELGNLGTDSSGYTSTSAYRINDSSTAVGESTAFQGDTNRGNRPVAWLTGSTTPTQLPTLGVSNVGFQSGVATDVNQNGLIVGYSNKFVINSNLGRQAVAWNATGTTVTELGGIAGSTETFALEVSGTSTAVGYASTANGARPVRWLDADADSPTAQAVGIFNTDSAGSTSAYALAVNDTHTAVGWALSYTAGGSLQGTEALRWDADTTTPTAPPRHLAHRLRLRLIPSTRHQRRRPHRRVRHPLQRQQLRPSVRRRLDRRRQRARPQHPQPHRARRHMDPRPR